MPLQRESATIPIRSEYTKKSKLVKINLGKGLFYIAVIGSDEGVIWVDYKLCYSVYYALFWSEQNGLYDLLVTEQFLDHNQGCESFGEQHADGILEAVVEPVVVIWAKGCVLLW